jgi:hypothetical protein
MKAAISILIFLCSHLVASLACYLWLIVNTVDFGTNKPLLLLVLYHLVALYIIIMGWHMCGVLEGMDLSQMMSIIGILVIIHVATIAGWLLFFDAQQIEIFSLHSAQTIIRRIPGF